MSTFTIPGKVFIIGEYSVLQGGRALIAALRPGYQILIGADAKQNIGNSADQVAHLPHPQSPLGRYSNEVGKDFLFSIDADSMSAGFGSSTAELIAGVMEDVERLPETKRLWAWYKEQFPKTSGADLAVQMEALRSKRSLFEFDQGEASALIDVSLASHLYLFQVNPSQKLKTHEALNAAIPKLDIVKLNSLLDEVKSAFASNELQKLTALNTFADALHAQRLETPFAHEVRTAFAKEPNVLAVKGSGAGMNDAFLVVTRAEFSETKDMDALFKVAKSFHLIPCGRLKELLW
jgi:homoserine kinase